MRALVRLLTGLPAAAVVTALLFWLLASQIQQHHKVHLSQNHAVRINVTRQVKSKSVTNHMNIRRPTLNQAPPPPPAVNSPGFRPKVSGQIGKVPNFSQTNLDIGTGFNPDRNAQPLVRIPPQYPGRCQARAKPAERVEVQFNVSAQGAVVNPEVISSTNSCFNEAALRAVRRWKYQPKVRNNKNKPRYGVRTQFTFKLAQ